MKLKALSLVLLILSMFNIFAQERNISDYLQKIESGRLYEIQNEVNDLIKKYPDDPSIIFLSAVITEDADESIKKYSEVYQNYPNSRYADASLFRLYSYFYAIGSYMKAQGFANKLKSEYPKSPYIRSLTRSDVVELSDNPKEEKQNLSVQNPTAEQTYLIQVGAFINVANANELKSRLEKSAYSVEIKERAIGGIEFHIVYVGRFNDKSIAEKEAESIKLKFNLETKLITSN